MNNIRVSFDGAIQGDWWCSEITEVDRQEILPYGDDLLTSTKVQLALADWEHCLVLRIAASSNGDAAILVRPVGLEDSERQEQEAQEHCRNDGQSSSDSPSAWLYSKDRRMWLCQYVGAIFDKRKKMSPPPRGRPIQKSKSWHFLRIKMGIESSWCGRLLGSSVMKDAHKLAATEWGVKRCKSCFAHGWQGDDEDEADVQTVSLEGPYHLGDAFIFGNLARAIISGKPGAMIHAAQICLS